MVITSRRQSLRQPRGRRRWLLLDEKVMFKIAPRNTMRYCLLTVTLCPVLRASGRPVLAQARVPGPPAVRVVVDPRVELLSIIFRLAGNREYSQGRVPAYVDDVEEHFGRFRDHPAVELAATLRRQRGVCFDACMSMAVHLSDAYTLETKVPLDPLPENLDRRWGIRGSPHVCGAGPAVCRGHRLSEVHRRTTAALSRGRVAHAEGCSTSTAHLEWFDDFFGRRERATFNLALGMLNGGACYGSRCRTTDGKEELYCILGVWRTDNEGMPQFGPEMLSTVVHEFCHSYTNPIVDRHADELQAAGEKIFPYVKAALRRQAYGNWKTMMRESMVRAGEVRYAHAHRGPEATRRAIAYQKSRKFLWIEELSDLLGEYEAQRDKYPDLDAFFPRVVEFFDRYADKFVQEQGQSWPRFTAWLNESGMKLVDQMAQAAARPKIVSITPANGAADVDPALQSIRVVFDRPMAANSWSMVGGGPNFPELTGKPSYDSTRTVWSVPVKLKPDWSYRFMLNSDRFQAFRSQGGVSLAPVGGNLQDH